MPAARHPAQATGTTQARMRRRRAPAGAGPRGPDEETTAHAEDEDPQRCEEALPGDRQRQAHAPPGRPATWLEHKSSTRTRRLTDEVVLAPADTKKIKRLLGQ